jgi:hypothetical protein
MKQLSKAAGISLLLLLSSCTSKQNHQELYFVAIEDFVLGSAHYFPLNRLSYLESLKKLELERECKANIDSLIERWTIPDQYGGSISEAKIRSLYRDLMVACAGSEDFEIAFSSQTVSSWALDAFRAHYQEGTCESSGLDFKGGGIAGLPYKFVKAENLSFIKEAAEQKLYSIPQIERHPSLREVPLDRTGGRMRQYWRAATSLCAGRILRQVGR